MKSLYRRKIFIFNFNVVFIYKVQHMCELPASHLKVHATIEKGLADEQGIFADFFGSLRRLFCSWRCLFSLVACICRWELYSLIGSVAKGPKFRPQNVLNSCQKLVLVYLSYGLLNFPLPFWLILQKPYNLATLARVLCSPAMPFIMPLKFKILYMKMTLKYKINIFRHYQRYYISPLKPSAGLPIPSLMRHFILSTIFCCSFIGII
jgi:carbon starvation protein CstA